MEMQGSRQLAVTQQQAWDALNDPEVLKTCIAGCDTIDASGDKQYAICTSLKIGPVAAKFKGNIALSEVVAPESYTLSFDGQGGVAGFGKGTANVRLDPNDAGCQLNYVVKAQVGGKIAQLGQRLIDGVAKTMAEDFFKRFDEEMQRRYPAAHADASTAESATPANDSITAVTANDARGSVPTWLWVVGAAVLLAIAWAALR
jgi:uncharacterized protein